MKPMSQPTFSPAHNERLSRIQEAMRGFHATKKKVRIYHGGTNSTRPFTHTQDAVIDISDFTEALSIDPITRTAWVEPNVPMKALVEATLEHGLLPPVVMELRSITVGGGIQGGAGESSSFRYGLFHDNVEALEVMLGNGDIVMASPTENIDLFYHLPCTYGTVAVITAAKLKLIPAKPYVRLRYDRVDSHTEMMERTRTMSRRSEIDFLDGIMFQSNRGVVMSGVFADSAEGFPMQRTLRAIDEWFYLQTDGITQRYTSFETILPIRDYLFRYNRGAFWTGRFGFELLHFPFVRPLRILLAPIFKTRILYRLFHLTGLSQRYLIQDCSLPEENILPFMDFLDTEIGIYPLWICPLIPPKNSPQSTYGFLDTELMINVGIWGKADLPYTEFVALNRKLERSVANGKGCKVLYAHSYYTPEEFWSIYQKGIYERIRTQSSAADVFPEIYDKVVVKEVIHPSFLPGLVRGLLPPYRFSLRTKK